MVFAGFGLFNVFCFDVQFWSVFDGFSAPKSLKNRAKIDQKSKLEAQERLIASLDVKSSIWEAKKSILEAKIDQNGGA